MNIMQVAMSRGGLQQKFRNKIMQRADQIGRLQVSWEREAAPDRGEIYRKVVREAVTRSNSHSVVLLAVLDELKKHQVEGSRLWHILGTQLSSYSPDATVDQNKTKLLISSLSLVQE